MSLLPELADTESPLLIQYVIGCFLRGLCLESFVSDPPLVAKDASTGSWWSPGLSSARAEPNHEPEPRPLLADPLPLGTKGLPPRAAGLPLGEIGSQGWNVLRGEVPLPVAVLKDEALAHNLRVMRAFADRRGGSRPTARPRCRRSSSRCSSRRERMMHAATISHVALYRRFGVSRILLANQLVDPVAIEYLLDELERDPKLELLSLADSREGVDRLSRAFVLRGSTRPFQLLLEATLSGRMRGLRTLVGDGRAARHIKSAPGVELRGVEAFEVSSDLRQIRAGTTCACAARPHEAMHRAARGARFAGTRPASGQRGRLRAVRVRGPRARRAGRRLRSRPAQRLLPDAGSRNVSAGAEIRPAPIRRRPGCRSP